MGNRFKLGENEKEIIKAIGLGLFIAASIAIPNLPMAIQPILKMRGKVGFDKLLKRLEKKRIIYLGGEKIKLTKKGRVLLKEIYLSNIKIQIPKKWDGKWWVVAYDIPEIYKKSRNIFRSFLERNDFFRIQKSLWAFPYNCKEEIAVIAKDINILPFVVVMSTDNLPNRRDLEEYYNIKSLK